MFLRIAALIAAAAIASLAHAVPAHADQTSAEAFWLTVHDLYHIPIGHDEAMTEGPAVCVFLDQPGTYFAQAGLQLMQMHPDWTPEQAGQFAGAATGAWCPQDGPSGGAPNDGP